MKHFHKLLILVPVSFFALVGCSQAEKATKQVENAASPAANLAKSAVKKVAGEGVSGLVGAITKTQTAIKAGDFKTAQTEFKAFQNTWKTLGDGIKAKSAKTYDAIEKNAKEVNGVLNSSKPDQGKALKALESLGKAIAALPKS
ncbi:DUF4363 domain-containing protein [Calothrix rhizosoleniae]|uniref:DUF4363 domain-containing protein n=1 Tax=Calothrix rhizosoleniae TaxID=888997 RepID=UPI000B49F32F|nr:DUF4363 domain-containing protein [Calothrix rhizosoleniae]